MAQLYKNNASSFIPNGITAEATTIVLATGAGNKFPNPIGTDFFLLTLVSIVNRVETEWEIVKVTGRVADTLTIVRGQEGTTAKIWVAGTPIELRLTAGSFVDSLVTGGGEDKVFFMNDQHITQNFIVPSGKNAMSAGPIIVDDAVSVSLAANSYWTIVNEEIDTEGVSEFSETSLSISGTFGVDKLDFTQGIVGAVRRDGVKKLKEIISVTDFYANGVSGVSVDPIGVVDSTLGIQAAINYVKTYGGVVNVPPGTYSISTLDIGSGLKPWALRGAGREMTKFVRNSNNTQTLFFGNNASAYGYELSDFSIDAAHDVFPNGNKAIVIGYTDNCRISRLRITNFRSGIMIYANDDSPHPSNHVVEDVEAIGNGETTDNGLLMVNCVDSRYLRCRVSNVLGDPGCAVQYKNACSRVFATDCAAYNSTYGYAHGYENTGLNPNRVSFASVNGFHARKCRTGFVFGRGSYNTANNVLIDMEASMYSPAEIASDFGISGISVNEYATHNYVQAIIKDLPPSKRAVRISDAANNNVFDISIDTPSTSIVAEFSGVTMEFPTGTTRNIVRLNRQTNPEVRTSGDGLPDMVDFNGSVGNGWQYLGYEMFENLNIVAGAVTPLNTLTTHLQVDTEGEAASDNLDTINFPSAKGKRITLSTRSTARDVTIRHAIGNIYLNSLTSVTLTSTRTRIELQWNSFTSQWCEI